MKKIKDDSEYFMFYDATKEVVLDELNKFINSVDDEFKNTIRFSSEYDVGFKATYKRLETDKEFNWRINQEKMRKEMQERNEFLIYERLKKKFGGQ